MLSKGIEPNQGASAISSPSADYRLFRLVVFLVLVLAAVLVARSLVVLAINSGRLDSTKLEGFEIHGKYYPVEKVCQVVDDGVLEKALQGSLLERADFSLLANGNGFSVDKQDGNLPGYVSIDCGWKNWEYDTDPEVFYQLSATIYADQAPPLPCRPTQPDGKATTVSFGGHTACRSTDGFEIALQVGDDNAVVRCAVKSKIESLLDPLEDATRKACADFIDHLSRSRPLTYGGNAFWTIRPKGAAKSSPSPTPTRTSGRTGPLQADVTPPAGEAGNGLKIAVTSAVRDQNQDITLVLSGAYTGTRTTRWSQTTVDATAQGSNCGVQASSGFPQGASLPNTTVSGTWKIDCPPGDVSVTVDPYGGLLNEDTSYHITLH